MTEPVSDHVFAIAKKTNVRAKKEETNVRLPLLLRALGRLATSISPVLAAKLIFTLFTTPRRRKRPAREQPVLRRGVPFRLRLPSGARIWSWSWGAGPTVALVHGWEGRGSQLSAFVGPLVKRGYRVVTFDAPAHGDSVGVRADVRDFAAALLALAAREGGLHAVVAHSMGGLATGLATRQGLQLDRVALVAPAPSPAAPLAWLSRELTGGDRALDLVRDQIGSFAAMDWQDLAAGGMYDTLNAPTLVVQDKGDRLVDVAGVRQLAERADARYVETDGLGHNRILRDESVVRTAISFLEEGRAAPVAAPGWQRFLDEIDIDLELDLDFRLWA